MPRAGPGPDDGHRRRRDLTDLYASILEVIRRYAGGGRVTRISYGAGMPVDRLKSNLARLGELGLLRSRDADGYTVYEITPRGHDFLSTYWKMRGFVEVIERDPNDPWKGR